MSRTTPENTPGASAHDPSQFNGGELRSCRQPDQWATGDFRPFHFAPLFSPPSIGLRGPLLSAHGWFWQIKRVLAKNTLLYTVAQMSYNLCLGETSSVCSRCGLQLRCGHATLLRDRRCVERKISREARCSSDTRYRGRLKFSLDRRTHLGESFRRMRAAADGSDEERWKEDVFFRAWQPERRL